MKELWKNYSLSIVLFLLFAFSWLGHGVVGWEHFVNEQLAHQQPVEVQEFWIDFADATLENWQSEFLQLLSMVVLTSFLIHKGSSESKDSNDQMQQSLDRIERQLQRLSKA